MVSIRTRPGRRTGRSATSQPTDEVTGLPDSFSWVEDVPLPPNLKTRQRGTLAPPVERPLMPLSPQQKLLLLDTWQRSGLPARDFAALVGISQHTLYAWKKQFEEQGPAGLMDQPRGAKQGSKLPELTKRTILMLKQANPEWGCQRISDMLLRGPALPASPAAVARVLHEAGYELRGGADPAASRPGASASSGPRPTSSGRPTCSRSCSSGRTAGSTWWPSWTTTAASSSATGCTPASRRRWCWRCCGRRSPPTARRRRS